MKRLTVAEVAQRAGKTPAAIYVAIRKGWLKAENEYGLWLVTEAALADYNPRRRGRPEEHRQVRTDISQSAVARELGVSRQRVNQIIQKESHTARVVLYQALKAGKVVKPDNCERCSTDKRKLEAHHPDYSKRLEVQWLCPPCHSLIHPHHPNVNGQYEKHKQTHRHGHKVGRPRRSGK